jgi:hypothetical protein
MADRAYIFANDMVSGEQHPFLLELLVGTGGCTPGDPVKFGATGDAGKAILCIGGSNNENIIGISCGTYAAGDVGLFQVAFDSTVFEAKCSTGSSAYVTGQGYGMVGTTNLLDQTNTTNLEWLVLANVASRNSPSVDGVYRAKVVCNKRAW